VNVTLRARPLLFKRPWGCDPRGSCQLARLLDRLLRHKSGLAIGPDADGLLNICNVQLQPVGPYSECLKHVHSVVVPYPYRRQQCRYLRSMSHRLTCIIHEFGLPTLSPRTSRIPDRPIYRRMRGVVRGNWGVNKTRAKFTQQLRKPRNNGHQSFAWNLVAYS
jgi:hypothetical protein